MNGLALSQEYFRSTAQLRLISDYPSLYGRLAAGLVGNGSECFGYDDELSRDHDWGVDFFLWLPEDKRDKIGELTAWKRRLFEEFPPKYPRTRSEYGAQVGVMTSGDFYASLLGCPAGPRTLAEWLRAPEENLAMAVNGGVFMDGAGEFTVVREYLLGYYPEDIRKKKLAAGCMALAQTGQYNLSRSARRADWVTVRTVLSRFTDSAMAVVFALNRTFRPYYKWAYRRMSELSILGREVSVSLLRMATADGLDGTSLRRLENEAEEICALIALQLRLQGLAYSNDTFLASYGEKIRSGIEDESLRSLPAQYLN